MNRLRIFGFLLTCTVWALCFTSDERLVSAQSAQHVYDALNRLVETHYPDKIIHYTYDDAGNRTGMTVEILTAAPAISSLGPRGAVAGGGGFTVRVLGSNFTNAFVVQWNGRDRA